MLQFEGEDIWMRWQKRCGHVLHEGYSMESHLLWIYTGFELDLMQMDPTSARHQGSQKSLQTINQRNAEGT